ncbi:hypothetical protein ACJMK2_034297 [Sinanodonta woodiana]|uniref:Uncharacterized protein n=1 Tax=Sinanodonta woodiana TaxID=1069815 RepID=A0ABD3WR48_SINWO
MEAKEYDNSGRQIKFIRGCTTVAAGEACINRGIDNITLCYKTCGTDGCNVASYASLCSISVLIPVLLTILFVLIRR